MHFIEKQGPRVAWGINKSYVADRRLLPLKGDLWSQTSLFAALSTVYAKLATSFKLTPPLKTVPASSVKATQQQPSY